MAEFTLLKIDLTNSDLTANAPYSRSDGGDADRNDDHETSSGRGRVLAALVGLCFCIAVAYLVRTRVLGGENDAEDANELDPTV
jgi:hypothetical protein